MLKTHRHSIKHGELTLHAISVEPLNIENKGLVLMCHGFPGLSLTWKRQMQAIAEMGFTAVAFDQRGFGLSSRLEAVKDYSSDKHCQDVLAILAYFNVENAVFIGHDFGAPLVWNMGVRYPEKCRAIIPISCPYDFDVAGRNGGGDDTFVSASIKPSEIFAQIAQHHFIHLHYFQEKGPADKELSENAREFLLRIYWALSARGNLLGWEKFPSEGTGYLDVLSKAPPLPWDWMDEKDFDELLAQYQDQGIDDAFLGGLNNYRVADINWAIADKYAGAAISVKTLFISGKQDPVLQMVGEAAIEYMRLKVAWPPVRRILRFLNLNKLLKSVRIAS